MTQDATDTQPQCFTFEVTMFVQVIADDADEARSALDEKGGFVTKRNVKLANTVELFNGEEN
jgi:hypothetical protein